jgi:hypothetical protein
MSEFLDSFVIVLVSGSYVKVTHFAFVCLLWVFWDEVLIFYYLLLVMAVLFKSEFYLWMY